MTRTAVQIRSGELYGASLHVVNETNGAVQWWNTSTNSWELYSVTHLSLYDIGAAADVFGFVSVQVPADVPDADELIVKIRLKAADDFTEAELQLSEATISGSWKDGAWITDADLPGEILVDPTNKLATDDQNRVTTSNPGTGGDANAANQEKILEILGNP